jgi:hypothetical protein
LYEYVLQFPDGSEEVRIADRPLRIGDRMLIGGRRWIVGAKMTGDNRVAARFLLTTNTTGTETRSGA